jgi:hypothetical protein
VDKKYYNAVTEMENRPVDREYMLGWIGGYLQNPIREEQRVNETYEAGYADGGDGNTSNFAQWVKK